MLHFPEDHALIHQSVERLGGVNMAAIVQHLVPETRIKEVQYRMFGTADVEVDGHPRAFFFRIDE